MPRTARFVAPGIAHHITQRGTDRQSVFYSRGDRQVYLQLLRRQAQLSGLSILAYCLMGNHIHLIAVPPDAASLGEAMQRVHGRYAQYLNGRRGRCGHLWQNRFNSCALSHKHLWAALLYVERNPVRAGLVVGPREYEWSSAEAHLSGQDPWRIADMDFWCQAGGVERWRKLLDHRKMSSRPEPCGGLPTRANPLAINHLSRSFEPSGKRRPPEPTVPPASRVEIRWPM